MTDFEALLLPDSGGEAGTLQLLDRETLERLRPGLSATARAALEAAGFTGEPDSIAWMGERDWAVGVRDPARPGRWCLAAAAGKLPPGRYRLQSVLGFAGLGNAAHGWLMAQHRFTRYRKAEPEGARVLLTEAIAAIAPAVAMAQASALVRDLTDTPANDMGPAEVEAAARSVATRHGAAMEAVKGEALLDANFPAIHAVGRASPRAPRLVRLDWGDPRHPQLTLVGKGICFDSGGLNIKPGSGMALMKKDMGGAAHALALAGLVMGASLPVRLTLLLAVADNAISGDAMRPGDILATRKGLSVEIGNTDAEGRLVLADALALAAEDRPALLMDFATLTGAARVALGPELPALFSNNAALAADLIAAGSTAEDPLWQLPLWQNYRSLFKSAIADLNNNSDSGFAGAIVAALFLERFVAADLPWAHIDLYAWNGTVKPGRPKGGAEMTLAACFTLLKQRFQ
ncbi:leucyl aminopeptidase family protein [Sandaracinobacteroides saxicola]|uniref:Leucyl aminopeptidase family protein n=1 Tax=Sandaracinobacteroides saxicola TaxID=2759707 RepID=A0A7G5IEE3_9SPHN|nr:leucyl aminopeptidase family protein [Sandaracinobacteroides saxicola]QMW21735.1 leucyl aminopeptidase family protein [Sandaracinobacteroides saxicola]